MKTDRVRLQHMLSAINEIIDMTKDQVIDRKTELAVMKLIEIIGEAARHTSPELKMQYSNVPWSNIIGMRNILIHEYFRVSESHIRDTVFHRIPTLKDWVEGILNNLDVK